MALLPTSLWILIVALSAPSGAAECFDGLCYYLGDPHAHTTVSGDAASADDSPDDDSAGACPLCGTLAGVFDEARANGLDWVALPDHINGNKAADPAEYDALLQRVEAANDPEGGFITVPAAEIWLTELREGGMRQIGHKTMLLFGEPEQHTGLSMSALQIDGTGTDTDCAEIGRWAAALEAAWGPLILMPHHPALSLPMATDWGCHYDRYEPLAEVHSQHGNSLQRHITYDDAGRPFTESGSVEAAIDPGRFNLRLGFAGGTDSHDTRPGSVCSTDVWTVFNGVGGSLTVAVLPEDVPLSRQSLFDAFQRRATYATTGPLLPVRQDWLSRGQPLDGVGGVGGTLALPADAPLDMRVRLPADALPWVAEVAAVMPDGRRLLSGDGAGSWSLSLLPGEVPAWIYVEILLDGGSVYPAGDCEDGGDDDREYLWLSPTWIDRIAPDGVAPIPGADPAPDAATDHLPDPDSAPDSDPPADSDPPSSGVVPAPAPGCMGGCAALLLLPGWGARRREA